MEEWEHEIHMVAEVLYRMHAENYWPCCHGQPATSMTCALEVLTMGIENMGLSKTLTSTSRGKKEFQYEQS